MRPVEAYSGTLRQTCLHVARAMSSKRPEDVDVAT